ncbi:MAG: hypothetical protein LLG00_00675 [Planctomycetaceae bacterium]|nr:hypothetical protein [Planctomycetaceae bacterium]
MRCRYLLTVVLAIIGATPLAAQMMPGGQMRQPGLQGMQTRPVELQGVLAGAGRGTLFVLDDRNQRWQVGIPNGVTVQVTGTLPLEALRTGLVVEFEADVDSHGVAKAKIGEMTVGSIGKDRQMGMFPAGADRGGDAAAPESGKGHDAAKTPAAARGKRTPAAASKGLAAGKYRVVGGLIVGRNGKLAVHAGRNMIQFELADAPQIKIDATDLSAARKGDRVSVKGIASTSRPGMVLAREVKVEVGQPAVDAKKKPGKEDPKSADQKPAGEASKATEK